MGSTSPSSTRWSRRQSVSSPRREVKERPEVVLAYAGYWSNDHIDALRARGMTPIVAPDTTRNRPRRTRRGGPHDFMRRVLVTEHGGELYSRRLNMVVPVLDVTGWASTNA
jgi:hypothetical protein